MLHMTSHTYQPTTKSSDRLGKPKRHLTFAISERKPSCTAHTQPISEDEDDGPLVQPYYAVVSDDEDNQPLVQPASRQKPTEKQRHTAVDDGGLAPLVPPRPSPVGPLRKRKGPPTKQVPTATLEQEVTKNSCERTDDVSTLSK